MTRYVQSDGDTFIRHIFDVEPTRWDADNFCFARKLTAEQAAAFGVSKLRPVTPPYYDPVTQSRYEGDAVLVDGEWTQTWIVSDADDAEVANRLAAQWANVRQERNARLAACDWTQLPDTPVDSLAWAEYRQALRDITEQASPFTITWPLEPGA